MLMAPVTSDAVTKTVHLFGNIFRRRHICRLLLLVALVACLICLVRILGLQFQQTVTVVNNRQSTEAADHRLFAASSVNRVESSKNSPPGPRNASSQRTVSGPPRRPVGVRCDTAGLERPPEDLKETFEWQKTSEQPTPTYVFSAFYDPRSTDRATVAVVAIASEARGGRSPSDISHFCHLWFRTTQTPEISMASAISHTETHQRKYGPVFFYCSIDRKYGVPYAVSLVTSHNRCNQATNVLRVNAVDQSAESKANFTVCVTPLNYNFSDFRQLVETIELNRMFGAERFVFYNYSAGSDLLPYINYYADNGLVTVIPWKLPVVVDGAADKAEPEIHYFGQLAALNECLLRNTFRSRYIAFTDLDEVIVPRKHRTWMEMVDDLTRTRSGVASLVFHNTFFRTDYEPEVAFVNDSVVRDLRLRSLLTTVRETMIFPIGWRSKVMVNPEAVQLVGVHHVERMVDYARSVLLTVDEPVALLHHYRSWAGEETKRQRSTVDRFMLRYNSTILSNVVASHRQVAAKYKGPLAAFHDDAIATEARGR